jgi:hypothetical protein
MRAQLIREPSGFAPFHTPRSAARLPYSVAQLLRGHVTCGDAVRTEEDALRKGASLGPLAYLPLA